MVAVLENWAAAKGARAEEPWAGAQLATAERSLRLAEAGAPVLQAAAGQLRRLVRAVAVAQALAVTLTTQMTSPAVGGSDDWIARVPAAASAGRATLRRPQLRH